ncbi:hypothetical protein HY990_06920 [Candidatus Micrarchaeota archaeon]|nr:hypothetical protein [Candidatus Micrarchaeota archaeon]
MSALVDEMLSALEFREVNSILPHEQVVSYNLRKLKEGMLNTGHLVDPLIVDRKTNVLLDGHHRLKVLQMIECPNAVCQLVDYMSPEITVGTWYPSVDMPLDQLKKLDQLKLEKVDQAVGTKAVDDLKAAAMVTTKKDGCYLINPSPYKLMEMVNEQNYLVSLISKFNVDYIPDKDYTKHVDSGRCVLYRRAYTKEEIVKTASAHSPLPPKSTRHLIPGRIIRLNMKLGWLHHSKEDGMKEMVASLESRVYSGNVRKYFEPVIVIY